jgi:transcriptional regulator with XRE-family HTH domain
MNLGNAIKQARKNRGLRQNVFAEMCGITPAYLSLIENNQKEPHLSTLKVISEKLDIPLPLLLLTALEPNDIKPEKKATFEVLSPAIKALVNEFSTEKS